MEPRRVKSGSSPRGYIFHPTTRIGFAVPCSQTVIVTSGTPNRPPHEEYQGRGTNTCATVDLAAGKTAGECRTNLYHYVPNTMSPDRTEIRRPCYYVGGEIKARTAALRRRYTGTKAFNRSATDCSQKSLGPPRSNGQRIK